MLLCGIVDRTQPLGKNMWEQVAIEFNSHRPRGASQRDYESLRRKFRKLYGQMKPSGGYSGLPAALKPVAWAHEIQHAIEVKAGAHEAHGGSDKGDEDDELLRHVAAITDENAAGASKMQIRAVRRSDKFDLDNEEKGEDVVTSEFLEDEVDVSQQQIPEVADGGVPSECPGCVRIAH